MASLVVAVVLELLALIETFGVFPVFDLAPVFILAVALVSRRWAGVARAPMTRSAILAAVLVVGWTGWALWFWFAVLGAPTPMTRERAFSPMVAMWPAVVVPSIALLVLFAVAAISSYASIRAIERPSAAETTWDL